MRFKSFLLIMMLLLLLPVQAQEEEFPTLEALARLKIPPIDFADTVSRLSAYNPTITPPTILTQYQIGDREPFLITGGSIGSGETVATELRGMTKNTLIWVEEGARYSRAKAMAMAEKVDTEILTPLRQILGYHEPAGVDGDPRLSIVLIHHPGFWAGGYFDAASTLPRELVPHSNQREMLVINLVYDDGSYISDEIIRGTIAHEFQHNLLHYRDIDEEAWLNEALSVYSEYYIYGSEDISHFAEAFLEAPETRLTAAYTSDDVNPEYGAGALFLIYIAEQYGDAIVARLHGEIDDGWRGLDKVLREQAGVSANEVFADWVLANYLMDAERGYGYLHLETLQVSAQSARLIREFPALHTGSLSQYSTEYVAVSVRGADKLSLQLTQSPVAHLVNTAPYEGDHIYYGVTTDASNSRLTRAFQLLTMQELWLEYQIWYDLAEHDEFAFVEVSTDRGETWDILKGEHTRDDYPDERFYVNSYTGSSGGWLQERIDLSEYAFRRILLRFEVYSQQNTTYRGLAIDDLRIDAIKYHDGFESPDDNWIEEGWIRTDNRLPQQTWVQVVQETPEELHLTRELMTESGEIIVDLLPNVASVHIAISPIVPRTSLQTQYALEARLFDAEGEEMSAARECTVTTTHGLNFRDAPNGNKIGLLPQGTAAIALDHMGSWFKVVYDNKVGWISADYVTMDGNCA